MHTYTEEAHAYADNIGHAMDYLRTRFADHAEHVAAEALLGYAIDPQGEQRIHAGRLTIPYLTTSGNVIDLRSRCTQDHDCKEAKHPKYKGSKGATARLYNAMATLTPLNYIAIIEGEIDTMTMHHIIGVPTVGVPGADVWNPTTGAFWGRLLADFDTVFVIADGKTKPDDNAPAKFVGSITATLDNATVIHMPDGHDLNSYWREHGSAAVKKYVGIPE